MLHLNFLCKLLIALLFTISCVNSLRLTNDDLRLTNETPNTNNRLTIYSKHKYLASGCLCLNYTCSCCSHVEIAKINLNDTG